MSILRLEGVRREIGELVILDSIDAALARGERVGLVGANGAGKTTLLEIVAGREEADAGRVHLARSVSVGLLRQEANLDADVMAALTVRVLVRRGADALERMEARLAELEARGAEAVQSAAYAELRERFEALDGYHLDQRVVEVLAGLGIPDDRWDRPPTELSGGQQTRVALARLLVSDPDLLLLDEPTNHLDVAALEWLEATLVRRRTALLVASHDRAFLDHVVERVWELRDRRLSPFRGDYSAYLLQREAADARRRSESDASASAMAHEAELVQRYRSQRKHVKMHEHERRLERLRASHADAPRALTALRLPATALGGASQGRSAETLSLEDVVAGYRLAADPGTWLPIVRTARLEVRRGERIGLVGPNGAGKSTLLRTVAGRQAALGGFVRVGRGVSAGYLAQLRDEPVPGTTVLDALLASAAVTPGAARSYLARFLFRGDDVDKPVRELSGGERSRLELALLGVRADDLLLLDEPTNHLDIPAREALETYLRSSEASLLLVSHDRRLLELICTRLWVVEPDAQGGPARVAPFEGSYGAWRSAVADGWTAEAELRRRSAPAAARKGTSGVAAAPPGRPTNGVPARRPPGAPGSATSPMATADGTRISKEAYRREHRRVEADLERLAERRAALEAGLDDPAVQANYVELRRLSSELADVDQALSQAEDAWLSLEERASR